MVPDRADGPGRVIRLLDGWVRDGAYPTGAAISQAFAGDRGISTAYVPGPWPGGTVS